MIEEAQVVVHKAYEPDFLLDFADTHLLAGEDMAKTDLALADADAPAMGHGDRAIVEGILGLG